ncbi:hypothetical protein G7069_06965 [Lysobacter sp. HDW10]|nr:hypothetical protein G7069_06965 [Lysobacter sp. HDW10]
MSKNISNAFLRGLWIAVSVLIAIRLGGGFWREIVTAAVLVLLPFAVLAMRRRMRG